MTCFTQAKNFLKEMLVVIAILAAFLAAVGVLTMTRHSACGRLNEERLSHLEPGQVHPGPRSMYVKGAGPGPPPSELVAYYEAEAAMENEGCEGTGRAGPGD